MARRWNRRSQPGRRSLPSLHAPRALLGMLAQGMTRHPARPDRGMHGIQAGDPAATCPSGSRYIQGILGGDPAGTPPIPIALVSLDYHFLNWRRDWRLRKQTPVVALQPQRALDISAVGTLLVYVALMLLVGAGLLRTVR